MLGLEGLLPDCLPDTRDNGAAAAVARPDRYRRVASGSAVVSKLHSGECMVSRRMVEQWASLSRWRRRIIAGLALSVGIVATIFAAATGLTLLCENPCRQPPEYCALIAARDALSSVESFFADHARCP